MDIIIALEELTANGKFLNDYLHQKQVFSSMIKDGCTTKSFNPRKEYFFCSNLERSIDQHKESCLLSLLKQC